MKKLYILLLLSFFGTGLLFSQVTVGPRFATNFVNLKQDVQNSEDEQDFCYKPAVAVGIALNIPLNKFLTLQPSLSFSNKGAGYDLQESVTGDIQSIDGYQYVRFGYLELPVNLAAGLDVGTGQVQLFLGPYIATGLSSWFVSNYTITYDDGATTEEDDKMEIAYANEIDVDDMQNGVGYMKPIDYGVNFGFGYQISKFLFNVGYSMGFQNLATTINDPTGTITNDDKLYNRMGFVSIALLLGTK
jgi:hypothetical protein